MRLKNTSKKQLEINSCKDTNLQSPNILLSKVVAFFCTFMVTKHYVAIEFLINNTENKNHLI